MANTYNSTTFTSGSQYNSGDHKVEGTLTAGAITGNVTGNVTGNIAGAVVASTFTLTAGVTPGTPVEGMLFAKASDHHLYYYNGTDWLQVDNVP